MTRLLKYTDKSFLIGIIAIALLLLIYFSPYLLHLNDVLFAASGDGLKNFYTLAYYVKYDSGIWFSGMLYPYGEHVSFTDNQPLVAIILNFIQHHVFDISPYLLGIVNSLVFLNFFVSAFFLYKILTHFRLPGYYSIACAVLIAFISPNVFRITGHYSLSYGFIIPLVLYLLILYDSRKDKNYLLPFLIAMVSFLSGLLHPYWVIITGMIVVTFSLVKFISEKKLPGVLLIAGLLGPIIFKLFLSFTDPVIDRPQDPWGANNYSAWFSSVFFPQFPLYDPIRNALRIRQSGYESTAFVGVAGMLFILVLAIKFFRRLKSKRKNTQLKRARIVPRRGVLRNLLFAGLLILMLSMFIPFRWGLEELFYKIPFLSQFRSLGRFAWAFYYIFCIYYSYGFWILLRRIRMSKGNLAFGTSIILLLFIWYTDVHFTVSKLRAYIKEYGGSNVLLDNKKIADLLVNSGFSPGDFQAVMSLPMVAEGSEKLWLSGDWLCKWSSLPYSYQTNTPILGCSMSRTSISRTLNLIGLTSSDYLEKKILSDFKSGLPILIAVKPVTDTSGFLLKRCREIARSDEMVLYSLLLDSLKKIKTFSLDFPSFVTGNFIQHNDYYTNDSMNNILYWTNENMTNDISGNTDKHETIDRKKFEINLTMVDSVYSLSCWIKITPSGNKVPYFEITELDSSGIKSDSRSISTADRNHYEVADDWVRFEASFTLNQATRKVELELIGKKSIVDHLLLKPQSSTVVVIPEKLGSRLYLNNYLTEPGNH